MKLKTIFLLTDSTIDEEDSTSQEVDSPNSKSNPETPRSLQSNNGPITNLLPEKGKENERKRKNNKIKTLKMDTEIPESF